MRHLEHNQWYVEPEPVEESDSWLVTYLDMITLLLVFLVAMLAIGKVTLKELPAPSSQPFPALTQLFPGQADLPRAIVPIPMYPATPVPQRIYVVEAPAAEVAMTTSPEEAESTLPSAPNQAVDPDSIPPDLQATPQEAIDPPGEWAPASPVAAVALPDPAAKAEPGELAIPDPILTLMEPESVALPATQVVVAASTLRRPEETVATEPELEPVAPEPAGLDEKALAQLGEDIDIIRNKESISFRINSEILFSSGNTELSAEGLFVLQRLIPVFKSTEHVLTVEGHTDAVPVRSGPYPSNWELSGARAASVVRYMQSNGIVRKRLRAIGYADTRPLTTNHTEKGRAINRRVELILEQPRHSAGPR